MVLSTAQAQTIGTVRDVVPNAFGTPPEQNARVLALDGIVVSGEILQTAAAASVRIEFLDKTDLRLGAESQIVLDELIYDPNTDFGDYVFEVAVGIARFISGEIDNENFSVETPTVTIGVRGTDFVVEVATNGDTQVGVFDGNVIVTPLNGPPAIVNPGQTARVNANSTNNAPDVQNGFLIEWDSGLGDPEAAQPASDDDGGDGNGGDSDSESAADVDLAPIGADIVPTTVRPPTVPITPVTPPISPSINDSARPPALRSPNAGPTP